MKKILIITILFYFLLFFSSTCQGNFGVSPRELSVTMIDEFIQGNTLKSIRVTNTENEVINVSWYLDHPSSDMIRPNKTTIPILNWIKLEPKWKIIPIKGSVNFYVYLNIPEENENLNQNWESWIIFKQKAKQFINIENAVRFYINTPAEITVDDDQDSDVSSITTNTQFNIPLLDIIIAIVVTVLFIISIFYLKKKKK
jgi:hypothetical protein